MLKEESQSKALQKIFLKQNRLFSLGFFSCADAFTMKTKQNKTKNNYAF